MTGRTRLAIAALFIAATFAPLTQAQEISGPSADKLFISVTQNRKLSGTPIELSSLKVTTGFGEVVIPLTKIDGIKMHADADDAAVIAFKNGDLVTGKIELEKVSIKTDWGKAHINTAQIDSITSSPNAKFVPDASGGSRAWRFSNGINN